MELAGIDTCAVMEAPRRAGAVYGEEYRATDADAAVAAAGRSRPSPVTSQDHRWALPVPATGRRDATGRLQALCDGVFAVALTLLVLGLPKDSHHLGRDLLMNWPPYAAYVVTFVTVGIVWVNHHALLDRVAQANRAFLVLNLLLLLFVGVMPWPTGLVAGYAGDPVQARPAAIVYGLTMLMLSGTFTAIWIYLLRRDELAHPAARPSLGPAVRRSLAGPAIYALGIAAAILDATAAFAMLAAAAVYFAASGRVSTSYPAAR